MDSKNILEIEQERLELLKKKIIMRKMIHNLMKLLIWFLMVLI